MRIYIHTYIHTYIYILSFIYIDCGMRNYLITPNFIRIFIKYSLFTHFILKTEKITSKPEKIIKIYSHHP